MKGALGLVVHMPNKNLPRLKGCYWRLALERFTQAARHSAVSDSKASYDCN